MKKYYLIPITKHGDEYIVSPLHTNDDFREHIDQFTRNYLSRNFIQQHDTKIIINSNIYITNIFCSKHNEDAYVITDSRYIPFGEDDKEEPNDDARVYYCQKIESEVAYSEGILPGHHINISSHYITPDFSLLSKENNKEQAIDWRGIRNKQHTIIVGKAGSGKTTFLRKFTLDECKIKSKSPRKKLIPVYIQLRTWSNRLTPAELIRSIFIEKGSKDLADNTDALLESGDILLLLDGLDEAKLEQRSNIISFINAFSRSYPACKTIISSRPDTYIHELPSHQAITIKGFDLSRIKEFSYRKLYSTSNSSWKDFICALTNNKDILELTSNPLLLSIILFSYLRKAVVPSNKANVIFEFMDALLSRWDESRGITRPEDDVINQRKIKNILGKASFLCKERNSFQFTSSEFISQYHIDESEKEFTKKLHSIKRKTGLIRQEYDKSWSFSHAAYLDFFTSMYLVQKSEGLKNTYKKHKNNPSWSDVWYNACGLSSDPEYVISLLTPNNKKLENTGAIDSLNCALQSQIFSRNQVMAIMQYALTSLINSLGDHSCETSINKKNNRLSLNIRITGQKNKTSRLYSITQSIIKLLFQLKYSNYKDWMYEALSEHGSESTNKFFELIKRKGHLKFSFDDSITITTEDESPHIKED